MRSVGLRFEISAHAFWNAGRLFESRFPMSPLLVQCPNGHGLKVPPKFAGKRVKCPKCEAAFLIPAPVAEEIPGFLEESPQDDWDSEPEAAPQRTSTSSRKKKKPPESNEMGLFYGLIVVAALVVVGVFVTMYIFAPVAPAQVAVAPPPPAALSPTAPTILPAPIPSASPAPEITVKTTDEFRKEAYKQRQREQFKMTGLAFHNYHDVYAEFPVAGTMPSYFEKSGRPKLSWRVHILPYIDQNELYQKFHLDEPWDSPHNKPLLDQMPDMYHASEQEKGSHMTRVMVLDGPGTPFQNGVGLPIHEFRDGTSLTILCVLTGPDKSVPWTKPEDAPFDPANPLACLGTIPEEGFFVVMADGSSRQLPKTFNPQTFNAMATMAGGEPVNW